jgi:hypothetical protein
MFSGVFFLGGGQVPAGCPKILGPTPYLEAKMPAICLTVITNPCQIKQKDDNGRLAGCTWWQVARLTDGWQRNGSLEWSRHG